MLRNVLCKNECAMNRIKEVLDEKGIRQTWLAEKLRKSFSVVNAYACNRRQPSLELLFEIAQILGVDPKELIDSKKRK
ncbi:MAG: helix-turn-helix protein [Bacteroidetes bacterium]|nr:helix-turn-helix protein [Bacteroidota bacterium]MBP1616571.1 helix-turn-helix protein [Bacteroidota bacterium]